MILKEKLIFWPLLAVFMGSLIFSFSSQGRKKEAIEELLQDIEQATKKTQAKQKGPKDKWDFGKMKAVDIIDGYKLLLERSPFFRVSSEVEVATKKTEPIIIKEESREPVLKYKGRVMMGEKVMVIIEDQGTGKSSFLQEGDMIGEYLLMHIDDMKVVLKRKGGEEVVLSSVKKKEEKEEEVGEDTISEGGLK